MLYASTVEKLWQYIIDWLRHHLKARSKNTKTRNLKPDTVVVNGNTFNPYIYDNWVGDGYPNNTKRVEDLQEALSVAYYSPGPIDGIWGPQTKAALIHMQKDRGLVAEGVCGTATWKVLSK